MRAATVFLLAALGACNTTPPGESLTPTERAWPEPTPLDAPPLRDEALREPGCATLRDTEAGDVIHANGAGRVLYAHPEIGLAIVDVSLPDEPKLVGASSFVGSPLGVFERGEIGLVAFTPWNTEKLQTTIRAVDLAPEKKMRTLSELTLAGDARDVRRVGDVLVVTRDSTADVDGLTILTTVGFGSDGLKVRDEILLRGRGATIGSSPWGVAVARAAEKGQGIDRSAITYVSIGNDGVGSLRPHGTSVIEGAVLPWRRGGDGIIDVSEDNRVRVVACATTACSPGTAATFATIDFTNLEAPRTAGWSMIGNAGADGIFRFAGESLIVARQVPGKSGVTEIVHFDAERSLYVKGSLRVRGTIAALAVQNDSVVALGWTGDASAGKRAIVHRVDARSMRLVGSASFGDDWTWSPAWDDDRAVSFDPGSMLAAFPVTTVARSGAPISAVQILTLGKVGGPRGVDMIETEAAAQRLMFIGGRLLAFGNDGVSVVAPKPSSEPLVR